MRIIIIALTLSLLIVLGERAAGESLKCENEGCYEVIKTFAQLLEEKINETDKILAEAENDLNDVTFGREEDFQGKINEIDHKLTMLIIDLNTGIEGGEHTLFDLINTVFKAVNNADMNVNQLELSMEHGSKLTKIADLEFTEISDVIRQVQEQFNQLQNETETDLPTALQDAFDKSEKIHSETQELKEILDKMKSTLKDYESNLLNAKDLTEQAMEKFAATSKQMDETLETQEEMERLLQEAVRSKLPTHEFANMQKLSHDAFDEAESVFDDSLELLDEVSLLELNSRLDAIKTYVAGLDDYSTGAASDLKKFAEDNEKFLGEMERTIDAADEIKESALEQMDELLSIMDDMNYIRNTAARALSDKDKIISSARAIYRTLEDFTMKVGEAHEHARKALEKIPEIQRKIAESVEIVEQLENKVDERETTARMAKEKCTNAKNDLDEVVKASGGMREDIKAVADDLDALSDGMATASADSERIFEEIDRLKKLEGETEQVVDAAQEKVERTNMKGRQVDENVTKALEDIEGMVGTLEKFKSIDEKTLSEFEKKLNEIDGEIEETEIIRKIDELRAKQQEQDDLIAKYKMEIAFLEHQVRTIKENADSLEDKCFKRTRLEP